MRRARERCPSCLSHAVRLVLAPDLTSSSFACGSCGGRWDPLAARLTDIDASRRHQLYRPMSRCPQCASIDLALREHLAAGIVCRCEACGRVTLFPHRR